MARVYISCGSNISPQANLLKGLIDLKQITGNLALSPVYESTSVGFQGDNFLNLVAFFETGMDIKSVDNMLDQIETKNGRKKSAIRFSSRTIDFDLLLYDDQIWQDSELQIPRPEIYHNAFVLKPLADIAPNLTDPISKQSFAQLWQQFDSPEQRIWLCKDCNWNEQLD